MDTADVGYMALGWEWCFFLRGVRLGLPSFYRLLCCFEKSPCIFSGIQKANVNFFILDFYCSVDPLWFLVLSLFNSRVCSISVVTLSVLRGDLKGDAGGVIFALEEICIFQINFSP